MLLPFCSRKIIPKIPHTHLNSFYSHLAFICACFQVFKKHYPFTFYLILLYISMLFVPTTVEKSGNEYNKKQRDIADWSVVRVVR